MYKRQIHKPEEEGATQRLYVNCNAGRVLRPLVIIKDGKTLLSQDILEKISKKLISWNDLVRMGVIELLDANEEENCYVTFDDKNTKKFTHMEIFPSAILGAGASIIPYLNITNHQEILTNQPWQNKVLDFPLL